MACSLAMSLYVTARYAQIHADLATTKERLSRVEADLKRRNNADPLHARECLELSSGGSPQNPCQTTLRRLAQTPQQFHDRWVLVEGVYANGFEHSALYPSQAELGVSAQRFDKHEALWVHLDMPLMKEPVPLLIVGRFTRGPSGHLGDYFGELTDAKPWGHARTATR